MSGSFLLDTNLIIAAINREPGVTTQLSESAGATISVISEGEMRYGIAHSAFPDENLERFKRIAERLTVLPVDIPVSKWYGYLKHRQRRRGLPVPDNDLWIAATAMRHELTLVTRDRHFDRIEGLTKATW